MSRILIVATVVVLTLLVLPAGAADLQLIANGDFSAGRAPWWTTATVTPVVNGGVLEAAVAPGTVNPWNAIVGQNPITVTRGLTHTLSFDAWASAPVTIRAVVQLNVAPFTAYFNTPVALGTEPRRYTFTFTPGVDDPAAVIQLQIGGQGAITVFLDNVSLVRPSNVAPPARRGELLENGFFDGGSMAHWGTNGVAAAVRQGRLEATVAIGTSAPSDAVVGQSGIPVFAGGEYRLTVKAWASTSAVVSASIQKETAPFTSYFRTALPLTTLPRTFTFTFTAGAEDPAAALQFEMGGQGGIVVYLDNVSLVGPQPASELSTGEIFSNGHFTSGLAPWWTGGAVTPRLVSGGLEVEVREGGANPWNAILGQNNVPVILDGRYTLRFVAWASAPVEVTVLIQRNGAPFTQYFNSRLPLTTEPQTFTYTFTSRFEDEAATFQFQIGARGAFTFHVADVTLQGPKPDPGPRPSAVRANQVGYLTRAPKRATIAIDATAPQIWRLLNAADAVIASGMTQVRGADATSGEHLHVADFSSFETAGAGYVLEVYGERSHPFDLGDDVYARLKYDALHYFYQNRSGIEIALPYAREPRWARAAGHLNVPPNQGDLGVTCFGGLDAQGAVWPGCGYALDATKGWYDAGDHGKYVVNGGFAAWLLLNAYERAALVSPRARAALADGTSNIPESGNGVPDILDEARWEVEFLLAMQVPPGQPSAGMAHHKLHDVAWTGLGLAPAADPQRRSLYPPSTAATLNLSAVGAQCARLWRHHDRAFADRCLASAETAWTAALAHPAVFARDNFTGGGPYRDDDVSDEFYWAAAELYATTGKGTYRDFVRRSPHFLSAASLGWPATQALGTISLALHPLRLGVVDSLRAWHHIVQAADGYAAAAAREPYGLPYDSSGGYHWGSNGEILNNSVVLGLAHDVTGRPKYLNAISSGIDYLLGRNPNHTSYVSGWGESAMRNPHHRFWAPGVGPAFPAPPPGALAGGPNQNLQDPHIQTLFPEGCAPQKCYADHRDTYSTNEVAINWNAALVWVAIRLDDPRLKAR